MKEIQYKYGHKDVLYTYELLKKDIIDLKKQYNFLEVSIVGKSVENRSLYTLKVGKGPRKLFICGGTHGCEWITVVVLMKWIREICHLYTLKATAYGIKLEDLFEKATIHMMPMVNPDGIELQIKGLSAGHPNYTNLIKWNDDSDDFSKWKANIRGVDLNRNFDAKWQACKIMQQEGGIKGPWLDQYGGDYPESEPETLAIATYTREENFDMVLSYHTQGREIYWSFDEMEIKNAKQIGEKLAKVSGYALAIPDKEAAYAGYKDWFIKTFKKPGYTIECGLGENPLPMAQFDEIYKENFQLILISAWGE